MPWTTADVDRHKKNLTDKQKRQWVKVANDALKRCIADGGSEKACDGSAIRQANAAVDKSKEAETMPDKNVQEAVWSTKFVNDLPDSSFALILPGGEKNGEGRTKPRALRKLPYKDAGGKVDVPHLRNALARLPQMKDVSEAQRSSAKRKLEAAAKKHLKTRQEESEDVSLALVLMEVSGSLGDQEQRVRGAFRKAFGRRNEHGFLEGPYVRDVFAGHADLGDSVVVDDAGVLYQVGYKEGEDGFTFDDRPSWVQVELFYRKREVGEAEESGAGESESSDAPADVELAESATGNILELVEGDVGAETNPARQPLTLDIAVIRPGFGNARDNRYYGAEMLKRDAHVFEGAKMYATDHRPEEKSVRTEVAKIRKIVGFTDDGAPIARAVVFDPGFAEATRNRAKAGELGSLECSILATGKVKSGKVDGKKANVVEAITKAISVDFVTKAGAGGQALSIAEADGGAGESNVNKPEKQDQEQEQQTQEQESEQQPQEGQEVKQPAAALDKTEVSKILSESKLPTRSQERLTEAEYADGAAVEEAVQKEVEYIKELTGSGRVVAQGTTSPKSEERISEADFQKRLDAVDRRHGLIVKEA